MCVFCFSLRNGLTMADITTAYRGGAKQRFLWTSLREEPVLYILGMRFRHFPESDRPYVAPSSGFSCFDM
jgi:hypothetical protein